ncbi:mannan endo-1,4-beta-mannosidase 8-like isoform X2 [Asparagus officinalis]|uniref:mannan endo-1,4-beta-mannosidase 8-like isoform X2 n=1 Tax=Asparagus officinalis TaxID=4686 RepID=UPI00098E19DD|nr:mannan endo-1,4-beta-mannosidase 8-like isoform X2 [Asparagus officinalis]
MTHSLNHHDHEMMSDEEWGFVQKRGTQFALDGQPFYVNGFNTYWLMDFSVDEETRGKVRDVLRQASAVGLNVCRTWAFNDAGYRALQISPGEYDEEVFKGLDFVVSEAKKHKVRLILSLCNNWEEYGGKAQYVKWGKEAGLNLTGEDDFFKDPTIKEYYKAHVMMVLTRVNSLTKMMYKDDPTILSWELINEPRCPSDPSGDMLQSWIEEMASYVKSIDPNHLLEIGAEGFYGPSTPERVHLNPKSCFNQFGTDFIRNHQTPGIDFASVHIYTDSWLSDSISGTHLVFVKNWMEEHMDDAEKTLNMPVVFGEFGVSSKDKRFASKFQEVFMNTVYNTLLKSRKQGGSGGGCLFWQLFPEGTDHMDDGYAVVLSKSPATSSMISVHNVKVKSNAGSSISHEEL